MTCNDYQKDALRTVSDDKSAQLMEGLIGLSSEAGECLDILKKFLYQGHELDRGHLAEELGDVAWYLTVTADAIGYYLEDILARNVEKRMDRYPNGFNSDRSVNR